MQRKGVVQIRKKSGLENIDSSHGVLMPTLFETDSRDQNSPTGKAVGPYKGKMLLGTKQFLNPQWDDLKRQWAWGGTKEDLAVLISKLKRKYESGPNEGKVIEPGNVEERLMDFDDPFFRHSSFYGKLYMSSGRATLDPNDPFQEFIFLCYKGDTNVHDTSKDQNPFFTAGAKYEVVYPKQQTEKKAKDADKEIDAIMLLSAMKDTEERMRAIAEIMDLPGYSRDTEMKGVFVLLKDMAAQNVNTNSRYGKGKTYQDRFIELAKLTDEDLEVTRQILRAKKVALVKPRTGHFLFQGRKLEGVKTDGQLVQYFRDPANQEDYLELLDLLDSAFNKQ